MEVQKIINLLNNAEGKYSIFATKKMTLTLNRKVIIHIKTQYDF